jgi:hypothetical protein
MALPSDESSARSWFVVDVDDEDGANHDALDEPLAAPVSHDAEVDPDAPAKAELEAVASDLKLELNGDIEEMEVMGEPFRPSGEAILRSVNNPFMRQRTRPQREQHHEGLATTWLLLVWFKEAH